MKTMAMILAGCAMALLSLRAEEDNMFTDTVGEVREADVIELVRTVNASFTEYRATNDAKRVSTIYSVNRDAVKNAPLNRRKTVVTEVFATVPADALPAIADGFAAEFFSKKAVSPMLDGTPIADFAAANMLQIHRRCKNEKDGARRMVFAVIMFLKAAAGDPDDLQDSLAMFIPLEVMKEAMDDWIPAALGQPGVKGSYDHLVAASTNDAIVAQAIIDADNNKATVAINGPEFRVYQKGEMRVNDSIKISGPKLVDTFGGIDGSMAGGDIGLSRTPRAAVSDPDSPWYTRRRGKRPSDEPSVYGGQNY